MDWKKIKEIIRAILREVQKGNEPKAEDLGLNNDEFVKIAKLIKDEGYLDNVGIAHNVVFLNNCNVTMKGIEFLENNS